MAPTRMLLPRMINSIKIIKMWLLINLLNGLGFPRFLLLKIPGVVLVMRRDLISLCSPAGPCSALGLWRWAGVSGGFGSIPGVPQMWDCDGLCGNDLKSHPIPMPRTVQGAQGLQIFTWSSQTFGGCGKIPVLCQGHSWAPNSVCHAHPKLPLTSDFGFWSR